MRLQRLLMLILMQMFMLMALKMMLKDRSSKAGGGESDGEADEADLDLFGGRPSGARKFAGMRRMRQRWRDTPEKILRVFMENAKNELGVYHESQVFHLRDLSRKWEGQFPQSRGLWRVHYALMEAIHIALVE